MVGKKWRQFKTMGSMREIQNRAIYQVSTIWFYRREIRRKYTWESASVVQDLRKLIRLFYKDHLDTPTATFPAINTTSLMARPTVKLPAKQKRGQPAKRRVTKRVKWGDKEKSESIWFFRARSQ